ncbi:MAG: hypothetical protein LBN34_09645 [Clostridiales Family XIII bacterium]|jgi:hypothetical protein|nr:hypothetical protein [Clostridiales Family XIII bacterium]
MSDIKETVSKYLGATCEVNGKVFKIVELEYYPAVEPEGSVIDTRESGERFAANDIFVADWGRNIPNCCLVNIVINQKNSDEYKKIENLLIRGILDGNDNLVARQDGKSGPGVTYKYIFGDEAVRQDNNGQMKILEEPKSDLQIKSTKRKRDGASVTEPFEYNYYIDLAD